MKDNNSDNTDRWRRVEERNGKKGSLADLLPVQEHYFVLHDGDRYARHGFLGNDGLLVFGDLDGAERFCATAGKVLPEFQPVRVSLLALLSLLEEAGSLCVTEGENVKVAQIV